MNLLSKSLKKTDRYILVLNAEFNDKCRVVGKFDENFSKLKHEDITSWCFQNNSKTVNLMDQSKTTICQWTKTS